MARRASAAADRSRWHRFSPLVLGCAALFTGLVLSSSAALARQFNALAAWRFTSDGVLELRTSPGLSLRPRHIAASAGRGGRIWLDLQGEPRRPRQITIGGTIASVRIGEPRPGITRFVVELAEGHDVDPSRLDLHSNGQGLWRMAFPGLSREATESIQPFGEGSFERKRVSWYRGRKITRLSPDDLPSLSPGRYRVMLDAGHGGHDRGATNSAGLEEAEINLDVTHRVAALLEAKGVAVVLARSVDSNVRLEDRVQDANSHRLDAFVSIHSNALSGLRSEVNGLETYYFNSHSGRRLAAALHRAILASIHIDDRQVRESRFYVLRKTAAPAALVEMGYVTGNRDSARLSRSAHRQDLALGIAKGLLDFLRGTP